MSLSVKKDLLFLIGAGLMAYGLYRGHPSLGFMFGGVLLWLAAYAGFRTTR
jgi:hypothetical protein